MERDNIFLTEARREVLDGESDLSGKSLANEKSRIRTRSRAALAELQAVARSSEIENASVFDPYEVGLLIKFIMKDPAIDPVVQGLISEIPDRLQQHRAEVHAEISNRLLNYNNPEEEL